MLFTVEEDEPLDPLDVRLLGAEAEVLEANYLADAVEKFSLARVRATPS